MPNAVQASPGFQRIIIHHLSDLHYQQESHGSKDNPLVRYRGYLEQLEPARRPTLIVITGDLTATGNQDDLRTVAEVLRNDFPSWHSELSNHIFVVPGPRDFNWEGTDPPGLKPFYEAFRDFGLPSTGHGMPQHAVKVRDPLRCVAYPIDTCYSLDECRVEMKEQFRHYGATYHEFVKQYQQARSRILSPFRFLGHDRKTELAALRERYLKLTEDNDLTLLDAGRVHPDDLAAFEHWIASQGKSASGEDVPGEPLKILITHHPLAVQPELEHRRVASQREDYKLKDVRFEKLASAAGRAGFHLAIHGHIHKAQVLSDLSLLQDPDARHPMRQVGAGSLGDGKTFNEITATYTNDGDQNHWRLEIRTINLKAQNPHDASSFVLLNRTEDVAKRAEDLEREKSRREEFDSRVQSAMRQFSEAVHRTPPEGAFERPAPGLLPQSAMQSVESIIREVVFPGSGVRVRLFLKDRQHTGLVPRLTAVYLAPSVSDGSGPVTYPVSFAALSLLLGRTLIFPRDLGLRFDERDYMWLRRSGKDRELVTHLEALSREPPPTGYPGAEEAQRYKALLTKLARGMAEDRQAEPLTGADFYREVPLQNAHQTYPVFICVPYPRQASEGGVPEMPEVAVLVVSLKASEESSEENLAERATPDTVEKKASTPEHIGMLESLTELVGTILVSSSAVGKPRGVWDDRLRA
jgi:hypothetical protein